jgi:hypothetical protein
VFRNSPTFCDVLQSSPSRRRMAWIAETTGKGVASQWWALSDLNGRPFGCKPNALTAELSARTEFIVQEAAQSVNVAVRKFFREVLKSP